MNNFRKWDPNSTYPLFISLVSQIKATDHGHPERMSKSRLDVEWLPQPEPSSESLAFDEAHFTFAVMESDPVTQMVGIISTEITQSLLWFDIVGEYTDIILSSISACFSNHKQDNLARTQSTVCVNIILCLLQMPKLAKLKQMTML